MNEELKQIKKYYGEKMMHLCRTLFPTILEEEGLLIDTLLKTFEPNHFLYDDLTKTSHVYLFRDYIYAILKPQEEVKEEVEPKTPSELMSMAGYKLYECYSEEEIQKMNLIIALEGSGSFARTHSIIAELAKHKWNGEERETLFNIAVENSQVFYILEDEDVKRFYKSLLKGSRSTSENAQKIREILG